MPDAGKVDEAWRSAIEAVVDDPDGEDVRRSQGLWALAVRAELADGEVRCGGDVFGPVLTLDRFVVMRCFVVVHAADPARTRDACDAAWQRFTRVDEYGTEASPDADIEDTEPFGYPVIDGGAVVLGFDAREDEAPYPHRALTCLRILVEELRRHGCTPVRLVNPLRLPDDEGVDIGALADQVAASGGDTPPAETSTHAGRPSWLPPFHEVARARPGRPSGPVPFVLFAGTHDVAWDPQQGLLRLPRAETEAAALSVTTDIESLSAAGTHLRYRRLAGPGSTTSGWGRGSVDLRTGAVSVGPAEAVEVFDGWHRHLQLRCYQPARDGAPTDRRYKFELVDGPTTRELPLQDGLITWSRPAAQFSPSGRLLLTSHAGPDNRWYVVRTSVSTGDAREYDDAYLHGTASWSPDETRALIQKGNSPYVLALDSGQAEPVADWRLGPDEPTSPDRWAALGWLGNDGLLMSLRHGRRIQLAYQPLNNSARYPVLDIPVTATRSDTLGIALAPAVLHAAPQLIGYHPS